MYFMDKELDGVPALYKQRDTEQIVYVRYFVSNSDWEWYVMEYSPLQKLVFGLAMGKLEYFCLDHLDALQYNYDLEILRDYSFKPRPLKEIYNEQRSNH